MKQPLPSGMFKANFNQCSNVSYHPYKKSMAIQRMDIVVLGTVLWPYSTLLMALTEVWQAHILMTEAAVAELAQCHDQRPRRHPCGRPREGGEASHKESKQYVALRYVMFLSTLIFCNIISFDTILFNMLDQKE